MTGSASGEDALVEQPTLAWLCGERGRLPGGLGLAAHSWHRAGARRPARERKVWADVVLVGRLNEAVARINPGLSSDAVQRVCEIAMTGTSPSLIEDHRGLHELLLAGIPISYIDDDDVERDTHAKLVDFDEPANNEFLAVNQFTVIVGEKNRRPDILLFVNGLPLGQIELKAPGYANSAEEAVNQVHHYTDTIPSLYRYVEIVGVSDLMTARVGTITTPAEHFAEWKTMEQDRTRRQPQLKPMIEGVFAPVVFLELVRDFLLFETDGARTWKVMAKYHQVHAVHAAVESVAVAMGDGKRGGLVWHTQGAGKSYTMVFFTNKLRRDERFSNPTIVAVTDRTDLDNQLLEYVYGNQSGELLRAGPGDHRWPGKPARAAGRACGRDRVHYDPEVRARQWAGDGGALRAREHRRDGR